MSNLCLMERLIFWICPVLLLAGCNRPATPAGQAAGEAQSATNLQIFQVRGVVKKLDAAQKEIEIKHEAIPGYMPGMTMPFDVKDTNELAGLAVGDWISFRLLVGRTEAWIDQIRKIQPLSTNGPPRESGLRRVRDVEALEIGDRLPEYQLTNELGQLIHTSQFQGQTVAISFLFTRCPYPTFCPRLAQTLAQTQQALASDPNAPERWHLLTVSFDPENDTPAVLKRYAEGWKYDPARWTFATGSLVEVTALAEQFGVYFWRDESGSISHNLRTAVIDPGGKVRTILEGNKWTSQELIEAMRSVSRASRQG